MSANRQPFRLVINNTEPTKPEIQGVYLITDNQAKLVERVEKALRGGVAVLQYRAKDKSHQTCLDEGAELKSLCKKFGAIFIVNDSVELAIALDADGVHIGQDDGCIKETRKKIGSAKIIGKSTHNLEEALEAEQAGADYIGFGAIFPTDSKTVTQIPGSSVLADVINKIKIPIVAIGGINAANACHVIDSGADAVAVISYVMSAKRPEIAATELKLLFNRRKKKPRGGVLSIAGSDSGGGAGIQADLKVITLLGSYAATVLTALTAQNTCGVSSIHGLPPSFIMDQLNSVLDDIPIDVIKTGMLHTSAIVTTLSEQLFDLPLFIPLVIDPVMIAKGGAALLDSDSIYAIREHLLQHAYLLTPNIPESERLLGRIIRSETDMEMAAKELQSMGAANVLIKGGHLTGQQSTDILFDGNKFYKYRAERIFTQNTHGTGCSYSSAIATFLAQGEPLQVAIEKAKTFISTAIRTASSLGKGHSPVNHYLAAEELKTKE